MTAAGRIRIHIVQEQGSFLQLHSRQTSLPADQSDPLPVALFHPHNSTWKSTWPTPCHDHYTHYITHITLPEGPCDPFPITFHPQGSFMRISLRHFLEGLIHRRRGDGGRARQGGLKREQERQMWVDLKKRGPLYAKCQIGQFLTWRHQEP